MTTTRNNKPVEANRMCNMSIRCYNQACLLFVDLFSRFKTIRRKHNLESARGIPKENWG